jgi:hypothetical protein
MNKFIIIVFILIPLSLFMTCSIIIKGENDQIYEYCKQFPLDNKCPTNDENYRYRYPQK